MSKTFLSLSLILALNACQSAYPTGNSVRDYDEVISFTVDKIEESKVIVTGGSNLDAKKGMKFVFVYMTFINKSSEQQEVDFNRFSLIDIKVKYKLEKVMRPGAINQFDETYSTIESKGNLRRKLVFSAPQRLKPQNLFLNGKMIPVKPESSTSELK